MKKITVLILNWNGSHLLDTFLPSVVEHSNRPDVEIVVADNGSTDDSLNVLGERFPEAGIICLGSNQGYAGGYNLALERIDTPYVVLLNSDVEVTAGWLDAPLHILESEPTVAAVQPKIRSLREPGRFEYAGAAGGYIDRYGFPFCRGRLLERVEEDHGQYDNQTDIMWGSGACLFMRTDVYRKVGGLDSRFFAHQEEVDMCWRMRARGHRIVYTPLSLVFHLGAATLSKSDPRKTLLNFRNSLLMLYKNTPERDLGHVMRTRLALDMMAAAKFLITLHAGDFLAVISARREFRSMKSEYLAVREDNMRLTVLDPIPEQLPHSLIASFYLKGRKTYTKLVQTSKG
ncbi:MAG: glycosyltransferase family 2 protein [Tannerellaceae bacterium]|jgi:GT2 family glycosyltransferase|nr:glycosyltransferase family 2 protein [Tannerellaceae bacterium]